MFHREEFRKRWIAIWQQPEAEVRWRKLFEVNKSPNKAKSVHPREEIILAWRSGTRLSDVSSHYGVPVNTIRHWYRIGIGRT